MKELWRFARADRNHCSVVPMLRWIFLLASASLAGCIATFANHMFAPEASVYLVGNPHEIATWALSQSDARSIRHAITALSTLEREGFEGGNTSQADAARTGLLKINAKLSDGWPGLTDNEYRPHATEPEIVEALFDHLYYNVAGNYYEFPNDVSILAVFSAMEPSSRTPARLGNGRTMPIDISRPPKCV